MGKSKAQMAAEQKKAQSTANTAASATPAGASAVANGLNLVLLGQIVAASQVEPWITYAAAADVAPLVQSGYVNENPDRSTDNPAGERQVQATRAGIEFMQQQQQQQQAPAGFGAPAQPFGTPGTFGASPAATPAANLTQPTTAPTGTVEYAIATPTIPKPEKRESRVGKPSAYPFENLQVGQAFFIPASAERPEPWKTLASTVASATNRTAVAVTNADGTPKMREATRGGVVKQVPLKEASKKFEIHAIADGGAAGFGAHLGGVKGAGVWRVK